MASQLPVVQAPLAEPEAQDSNAAVDLQTVVNVQASSGSKVMDHPVFDASARATAQVLAATAGKPGTREPGLLAIHAALHRKRFQLDEDAVAFYQVKRGRYYEWKPVIEPLEAHASPLPLPPPLLAAPVGVLQQLPACSRPLTIGEIAAGRAEQAAEQALAARTKQAQLNESRQETLTLHYKKVQAEEWRLGQSWSLTRKEDWDDAIESLVRREQPERRARTSLLAEDVGARKNLLVSRAWMRLNTPRVFKYAEEHTDFICTPDCNSDEEDFHGLSSNGKRVRPHLTRQLSCNDVFNEEGGYYQAYISDEIKYSPPPSPSQGPLESTIASDKRKERHQKREMVVLRDFEYTLSSSDHFKV